MCCQGREITNQTTHTQTSTVEGPTPSHTTPISTQATPTHPTTIDNAKGATGKKGAKVSKTLGVRMGVKTRAWTQRKE